MFYDDMGIGISSYFLNISLIEEMKIQAGYYDSYKNIKIKIT